MRRKATNVRGNRTSPFTPHSNPFWLVLDVHGVLIPSSERWILGQLARQLHESILPIYLRWFLNLPSAQRGKRSAKSFYEEVFDRRFSQKEFDNWIMKRYAQRGTLSPVVMTQLKRLKQKGWKLAILSDMNTAQAEYHRKMKHFSLFDEVFLSCETGLMKPFPSAYAALEKRLHTRKDHIVFVDDLWFNTWGASLSGWRSVTMKGEKQLLRFLLDLQ